MASACTSDDTFNEARSLQARHERDKLTEEETKLKMPFEMDDDFEVEQKPRKAVH